MVSLDAKHPLESYIVDVDFNPLLYGDTTSGVVITAQDQDSNSVTDIFTSLGISSGIVSLRIKAGQVGFQYKITVVVTQTDGSKLEQDLFLDISDRRKPLLVKPFQTNQKLKIGVDFSDLLQDESIASIAFQAIDLSGAAVGDIYLSKGFDTNNIVSVLLKNLTVDLKDYLVYVIVTDTATIPNVYVEELFISVRNI